MDCRLGGSSRFGLRGLGPLIELMSLSEALCLNSEGKDETSIRDVLIQYCAF